MATNQERHPIAGGILLFTGVPYANQFSPEISMRPALPLSLLVAVSLAFLSTNGEAKRVGSSPGTTAASAAAGAAVGAEIAQCKEVWR